MKRIFLASLICLVCGIARAVTPSRLTDDGLVTFALFTVNGLPAYSIAERDMLLARDGGTAQTVTPTFFELAVSTNFAPYTNYTDFIKLLTSKPDIANRVVGNDNPNIVGLVEKISACMTFQSRYATPNVNPMINRLWSKVDLLQQIYTSLP